ncbi:MAG: SDR family NAD(P)-dependent oxidoreductase [Opitutae bacterium]|nr:SDR family NAD(P)-dependent oxidoreductase [Opitutae bacterium]
MATIVTGAGRGIGRSIAVVLGEAGSRVACAARTLDQIEETAQVIRKNRGEAFAMRTDVTVSEDVRRLVEATLDRFGRIDFLINNAGVNQSIGALWEVDPEIWWGDQTVNLKGPLLTTQAVLPHMLERDFGVIVNLLGGGAPSPLPGASGYACSKTALARMTDNLAMDLKITGSNVLVYGFNPGLVKTRLSVGHAKHPLAETWLPSLKENLNAGKHHAPEIPAKAILELLLRQPVCMAGRMFSVGMVLDEIEDQSEENLEKDLYALRIKP